MINREDFSMIIENYKIYFNENWDKGINKGEKFKWEAVEHFQNNWDIKSPDFADMFKRATAKTNSLLINPNNFPKGMIIEFATVAPEETRKMFISLFDESKDLSKRIALFIETSEELRKTYNPGNWNNHYQNINAISTYLWLRYPDKYYIYKYNVCVDVSEQLNIALMPKRDGSFQSFSIGQKLYDEICEILKNNKELIPILDKYTDLSNELRKEAFLHTITIDFCFFISRFYGKGRMRQMRINEKNDYRTKTASLSTIWKLSQGHLSDSENEKLRSSNLVSIGLTINEGNVKDRRTFDSQSNDFQKVAQKGDYFYLCYGNKVILYGQFTDNEIISAEDIIGKKDWICRRYTVIKESSNTESYTGKKFRWTPNYNSTFIKIPKTQYNDFENLIYKYYFENTEPKTENNSKNEAPTYLSEIIDVLKGLGGIASLRDIYEGIEDRELLPYISSNLNWKDAVRSELQRHCKQSKAFKEGNDNIFYKTGNRRDGLWGLLELKLKENIDKYDEKRFLSEVYMSENELSGINFILKTKKNLILQGAPGVGKTYAAKRIAYQFMKETDDNRICFIQFHQSYCYEDFICGYRPTETGFEPHTGPFYNFCEKARHSDKPHFFIIDEINRGNISKIFGELLMLIEADKRTESVTLSNGESFSVPENLYIIGMMNTADRSLAMIDYALRRRFSFAKFKPAFSNENFISAVKEFKNKHFEDLISEITKLNDDIEKDSSLGEGFMIGHSYFCIDKEKVTDIDLYLRNVVEYDIIPLLEEYWFDNSEKVSEWSKKLKEAVES